MLTIQELKRKSREQLKHNLGMLFLCTLIIGAINAMASFLAEESAFISLIASFIITPPLSLGATIVYLDISYGNTPEITTLFLGFRQLGQSVLSFLLLSFIAIFFSFLVVIPIGIIHFFVATNSVTLFVLYFILIFLAVLILLLPYSWIFYIMAENPELSAVEVLKESRRIMKGHMAEYILLKLSFFLHFLLYFILVLVGSFLYAMGISNIAFFFPGLVLIVIAMVYLVVYVSPYMSLSDTNFYHMIKGGIENPNNHQQNISSYPEESYYQTEGSYYQNGTSENTGETNSTPSSVVTNEPVITETVTPDPVTAQPFESSALPQEELAASAKEGSEGSSVSAEEGAREASGMIEEDIKEAAALALETDGETSSADSSADSSLAEEDDEEEWSWDNL